MGIGQRAACGYQTFEVFPLTDEIAWPFILKLLPVPAVSKVLFVNVSVVAFPTNVSVAAGSVHVPDAAAAALSDVEPDPDPARIRSPEENVCAAVYVAATDGDT